MKASPDEVYYAIDTERDYQKKKYSEKQNDPAAFITFMQHHLTRAIQEISTSSNVDEALEQVRKVTALGIACMEQHGAPARLPETGRCPHGKEWDYCPVCCH